MANFLFFSFLILLFSWCFADADINDGSNDIKEMKETDVTSSRYFIFDVTAWFRKE